MNNLYEDSKGIIRQVGTDNPFRIRVDHDGCDIVFVAGREEQVVATFQDIRGVERAYDSIIEHAVTVNDAFAIAKEIANE